MTKLQRFGRRIIKATVERYTSKEYRTYIDYLRLKHLGTTAGQALATVFKWDMQRDGPMRRYFARQKAKEDGVPFDPNYDMCEAHRAYTVAKVPYSPKRSFKLTADQSTEYEALKVQAKIDREVSSQMFDVANNIKWNSVDIAWAGPTDDGSVPAGSPKQLVTIASGTGGRPMTGSFAASTEVTAEQIESLGVNPELLTNSDYGRSYETLHERFAKRIRAHQAQMASKISEGIQDMTVSLMTVKEPPTDEQLRDAFVEALRLAQASGSSTATFEGVTVNLDGMGLNVQALYTSEGMAYIKTSLAAALAVGNGGQVSIDLMPFLTAHVISTPPHSLSEVTLSEDHVKPLPGKELPEC